MAKFIVPFKDAQSVSAVNITRDIRNCIAAALSRDAVWDAAFPHLTEPGLSGSAQFDHASVAKIVILGSPALAGFEGLTDFAVFRHVVCVLRARGYIVVRGYIVGTVRDDESTAAELISSDDVETVDAEEA